MLTLDGCIQSRCDRGVPSRSIWRPLWCWRHPLGARTRQQRRRLKRLAAAAGSVGDVRHGGGVDGRRDGEVLGALEAELPEEVGDLRAPTADAEAGLRRELRAEVDRREVVGAVVLGGI